MDEIPKSLESTTAVELAKDLKLKADEARILAELTEDETEASELIEAASLCESFVAEILDC